MAIRSIFNSITGVSNYFGVEVSQGFKTIYLNINKFDDAFPYLFACNAFLQIEY